jgi:hypothetical protein
MQGLRRDAVAGEQLEADGAHAFHALVRLAELHHADLGKVRDEQQGAALGDQEQERVVGGRAAIASRREEGELGGILRGHRRPAGTQTPAEGIRWAGPSAVREHGHCGGADVCDQAHVHAKKNDDPLCGKAKKDGIRGRPHGVYEAAQ